MLFGINSTSDARNSTRRSRVLFVALRVLLIPIVRLTLLSHANSISLLIYTLLYTALNKNNGVTKVNCGRMSIR